MDKQLKQLAKVVNKQLKWFAKVTFKLLKQLKIMGEWLTSGWNIDILKERING